MKKLLIPAVAALLTLTYSCKKEGCTDQAANNYDATAEKDDGSCTFDPPAPDPRDPYLGNYWVTDSLWLLGSFDHADTYALTVTTGGTVSDTIYLNNLWNDGNDYFAVMSGSNFSIPSQQVSGPYWASGSGDFTNDVITYSTSGDAYVNEGTGPKQ